MLELLAAKIAEKAGESAVGILVDAVKRANGKLLSSNQEISAELVTTANITADALKRHVADIREWCTTINFSEMQEVKSVARVYVDLDTYLIPLSRHETRNERRNTRPLIHTLVSDPKHCALLGNAGAGKTTSLKKICIDYFSTGKALLNYNFPLVIRLRELSPIESPTPICQKIQEVLSIRLAFPKLDRTISQSTFDEITRQVVAAYIDGLKAVILFDGFDEISSNATKEAAEQDIAILSRSLRQSKLIITSRSREFHFAGESLRHYEIAELTPDQIHSFAHRWLESPIEAEDFLAKIASSPFADTTIRPLTVAHLCAIYERIKDIPDKPKSVYRRIVTLLLKEWDEQRLIKRNSAYSGFDVDQKSEFLAHLAFELTADAKQLRFNTATLKRLYSKIHADHGLPPNDAEKVAREIESHNGLIIQSGHDYYEFSHKSLQEFLAADYIVRLPSLGSIIDVSSQIPNELAIAIALSSRPGEFLCELLFRNWNNPSFGADWYSVLCSRIVLEKAELNIGHTALTTVAVCFLLSQISKPSDRLINALQGMLPANPNELLSTYYSISDRKHGKVELTRLAVHKEYLLPAALAIPESILTIGRNCSLDASK